jgi:hypothetical protein
MATPPSGPLPSRSRQGVENHPPAAPRKTFLFSLLRAFSTQLFHTLEKLFHSLEKSLRSRMSTRPSPGLAYAVWSVVKAWLRRQGIPFEVLFPPAHLQTHSWRYADPVMWPSLYVLQHDEKDIKRVRGALQDWGDGEAARQYEQQQSAVDEAASALEEVRKLDADKVLTHAEFFAAMAPLMEHMKTLTAYAQEATKLSARHQDHLKRLLRRKGRLSAASQSTERLSRHIGFLNEQLSEIQQFERHVQSLDDGIVASRQAEAKAGALADLLSDLKKLLPQGLKLSTVPASKVLAVINSSIFDISEHAVAALYFTADDAKTWQIREAVIRTMKDSYQRGFVPLMVAADKAYTGAAHWDLQGFAKTRTAALREVEFFMKLVDKRGGYRKVSVQQWPRTGDLMQAALAVLRDPRAQRRGITTERWMNDEIKVQVREYWRNFLIEAGVTHIEVWVIGVDELVRDRYIDTGVEVQAAIKDILAFRCKELAEEKGLCLPGAKISAAECKEKLKGAGIDNADVELNALTLGCLRRQPQVRRGVHRWLHGVYCGLGRDFSKAFSYPEDVELAPGVRVPLLLVWDKPHAIKNARCASANAVGRRDKEKRGTTAPQPPPAPATQATVATGAEDDPVLFDEDENAEDSLVNDDAMPPPQDTSTLAYKVGIAAEEILKKKIDTPLLPGTMDPTVDAQSVPIAEGLYNFATVAAMRDQCTTEGHIAAAEWVEVMAAEYVATEGRGPSPVARWDVWQRTDDFIRALHPSFEWDVNSLSWASPRTSSIQGFSRVLLESEFISHDASRWVDIMIGCCHWLPDIDHGVRLVKDRNKGTNVVECLFSCTVAKMREDKSTLYKWKRMMPSIIRAARRKLMSDEERGTSYHTQQRHVYNYKAHVKGFRSCKSVPPCEIGAKPTEGCVCAHETRHVASHARLKLRESVRPEPSTRHRYHAHYRGSHSGAPVDLDEEDDGVDPKAMPDARGPDTGSVDIDSDPEDEGGSQESEVDGNSGGVDAQQTETDVLDF